MRSIGERVIALVAPRKIGEDERHVETVLNTILIASIGLLALLFSTIVYNSLETENYGGITVTTFSLIILFFVGLFVASRRGHIWFASYGIIGAYFVGSFYCGYTWGASLPATLLSFTLVIVMANLLLGMKKSLVTMLLVFGSLIYLTVHEMNMPQIIDWKNDPIELTDIISYLLIIAFMFVLSWISRRQTDRSLARARRSEQELEKERDSLEIKVRERTEELAHIAEFGRLSQGIFHDLLSPLSSMLLHVERMSAIPRDEIRDARDSLEKVSFAGKRFGAYLSSVRSAISTSNAETVSSFETELAHVENLLSFQTRERSVVIKATGDKIGSIPIEPIELNQILFNLVSNSLDAYEGSDPTVNRIITIDARKAEKSVSIIVRDHGTGIAAGDLSRIFEPFFTTKKPGKGVGLGLATVRRILDGIGGAISMESKVGKGATATVTIPL